MARSTKRATTNETTPRTGWAARLARLAGLAEHREPLEQLEQRQLLFALTVTANDINPATGIGTVTAHFGYTIPKLATTTTIQAPQPAQVTTEDFNDEPIGAVGSGVRLLTSTVLVGHNLTPAANFRIIGLDNQNPPQERALRVDYSRPGEFFQFTFANNGVNTAVTRAEFTVAAEPGSGSPIGLDTDQSRVDLLLNNEIIATFQGAALRALMTAGTPNLGVGTFAFVMPAGSAFAAFDTVRVTSTTGINPAFRLDNLAYDVPNPRFAQELATRSFGVRVVLSGPVGAGATFADLYGRDMRRTIQIITGGTLGLPPIDSDDNGVSDFNDGIGSIRLTGFDSRSSISMWGGTIDFFQGQPPPDADFIEGTFAFTLAAENLTGLYDDFEDGGFGYVRSTPPAGQPPTVHGLPPGPGSLIIGSPFVRDNTNPGTYNPEGNAPGGPVVTSGFTRPDQGIFADGGQNVGSVYIHGLLHGSSRFSGYVDRFYAGYLVGSLTVEGDAGKVIVGTDAGEWSPDPSGPNPNGVTVDAVNKTAGQLIVGRTLGELMVAGRNLMDVTVVGDVNSPQTRPAKDIFNYYETEFIHGINPTNGTVKSTILGTLANTAARARLGSDLFRAGDLPPVFGTGYFRNDTLLTAEFIGSSGAGVRIKGDISGRSPTDGEDTNDVYAFVADGSQEVVLQGTSSLPLYFRVIDENGRTLAAPETSIGSGAFLISETRFRPNAPGLYYLVVTDPNGATETGFAPTPYTVAIVGLAPTTFGAYRTGASSGFTDLNLGIGSSLQVLAGSMGAVRVGMGNGVGNGDEESPADIVNTTQNDDDLMSFTGGTYTIARDLYAITTGSDVGAPGGLGLNFVTFFIGGNLGTMLTGQSEIAGGPSVNEGDVNLFRLNVGGRVGTIDIRGGVGMDQDNTDPRAPIGPDVVSIVTGTAGGPGDIAFIRTGFHVAGDAWDIRTSPGSVIGALFISQDAYFDGNPRSGVYLGTGGLGITTGIGSDVRFVDLPRLDLVNGLDILYPIVSGQILNLTDDAGSRISISATGIPLGTVVGSVRAFPIDGSQGVAIGQIIANLGTDGSSLVITSSNPLGSGVVGIGHILLTGGTATSQLNITGSVEVDVYRIDGLELDSISNTTPNGDLVAVDVQSLNTLQVSRGNLGRTQVPAWGPRLIGPYLGVSAGTDGGVQGPLGVAVGPLVDDDFNGGVYRPLRDENMNTGNAYFDDIGSPLDGYLNGLVVRTGNVTLVTVGKAIGDVILQADDAVLATVTANADGISDFNAFEGIVGHVYANDIVTVNLGDGLALSTHNPMASAGIVAADDIQLVTSQRASGAVLSGHVVAGNALDPDLDPLAQNGVVQVTLTNATVRDAKILGQKLDAFWDGFNYVNDLTGQGDVGNVNLTNTDIFRSRIGGRNLTGLTIVNGFYDATLIDMVGEIGRVTATGYRNSTLTGGLLEQQPNRISAGRNLRNLVAANDITDLEVDIVGSVMEGIRATNIVRSSIGVNNRIELITTTGDIRSSSIVAGEVPAITVANMMASTLSVSGPLLSLLASGQVANSRIEVTGPDGRIDLIRAGTLLSGTIAASGPIQTLNVTNGDIVATITTTTAAGNVGTISASRDVNIRADISGGLTGVTAGRHIGSRTQPGVILVRGNLTNASAPGGQLYNDLRVGGDITGTVTLGGAVNKPGNDQVGRGSIVAAGRIAGVVINGDFGGDIVSYSGGIASVAINNGSFLPDRTISAFDGDIESLVITNGTLFGNVYTDRDLKLLRVVGGSGGVFGHLGVKPGLSQAAAVSATRNQLPAGVAQRITFQGPQIVAGFNIVNITVDGDAYEAGFRAGRAIQSITIGGEVRNDDITIGIGNFFAAGDNIDSVVINGRVDNTAFVAGMSYLGLDGRPGGTGANADILSQGSINSVRINGDATNITFSAGISPGADGVYNTPDDRVVLGRSFINTLDLRGGVVANVSAFGDNISSAVNGDSRVVKGGTDLPSINPALSTGTPAGTSFSGTQTFSIPGGPDVTITATGPGQFWFNAANRQLSVHNTTGATNITVSSSTGGIDAFKLISNDDASLGTVNIQAFLTGDSNVLIDGDVTALNFGAFNGTGSAVIGGHLAAVTYASLDAGFLVARSAGTVTVNGNFGSTNAAVVNEASIDVGSAQSIRINGASRARVNAGRDLDSLVIQGVSERALYRVGNSLVTFGSAGMRQTVLSVGDRLTTATIGGDMFDSAILAGTDLGSDAFFDSPSGASSVFAADKVTAGSIGTVTVNGNLRESDIVAGFQRGQDSFFGTSDDTVAPGRSTIGSVVVTGTVFGSTRNTESYRIAAAGALGLVTVSGGVFSGTTGNFGTESTQLPPASIQVKDLRVSVESRVFSAVLEMNQPLDASTVSRALSVYEVRGTGNIELRLIENVDYTVAYQASTRSIIVTFSRSVTERDLPQIPGEPGPGVFRFRLNQGLLQAKLRGVKVDGNGDGFALPGEHYSEDAVIGDAGDKLTPNSLTVGAGVQARRVDFYGPVNLDVVLDGNAQPDGLPDTNKTVTIRGAIGDHPDNDTNFFRFAGDTDLYAVTLQAGQILRLGGMQGSAQLAPLTLIAPDGSVVQTALGSNFAISLPAQPPGVTDLTSPSAYLIKTTGRYIIAVDNAGVFDNPAAVPNLDPIPGAVGDYSFTVEIFDDGDSGFSANTEPGNGRNIVTAPAPIAFAGPDQVFGTADDPTEVIIGAYTFTLNRGPDNQPNTADDVVSGSTADGAFSVRNGDGTTLSTVSAAIGPVGHAGRPTDIYADVDVFHLNNRQAIAPGTKMRLTLRLTDLGGDMGSAQLDTVVDNRGMVQFGLFDTTNSTGLDDAILVFSPTDFSPNGGAPNTIIASDGQTTYGYDSRGDFFIEFIAPSRMGSTFAPATFAVYVQGANNTDYSLEVATLGTGQIARPGQNFFIETAGGSVDWLQVGGVETPITPFSARVLGFQGTLQNGQDSQVYILSSLVSRLNSLFRGAGFDVTFSTNPSDFEFEPFSTVFLSANTDPITPLFSPFQAFNITPTAQQFNSTEPYGYSQHSDPFNADHEDEAVVFAPSFAMLGLTPSQADVDRFVQSMTAAVARRAGELMGLRISDDNGAVGGAFDPMAADSVENRPAAGVNYTLGAGTRALSGPFDGVTRTDFLLGRQNNVTLLDKLLGRL